MRNQWMIQLVFSCTFLIVGLAANVPSLGMEPLPDVEGVFGMESAGEQSWLAVKMEIPEGSALNGILWYNNDGLVVFPRVLVGTGFEQSPGNLDDFSGLATEVSGESSGWSELTFSEPVAASLGSIYLAFEFPHGQPFTERGEGGGPAVGYLNAPDGCPGWLSGDGEIWARLHPGFGFGVQAEYIPFEDGMLVKSFDGGGQEVELVPLQTFLKPSPNPFNPTTEIRFGLDKPGKVHLDVFDIRGYRVAKLVNEYMDIGQHAVAWQGKGPGGESIASGVYFIRLKTEEVELRHKVLLLK
jgi:hypothetical protein